MKKQALERLAEVTRLKLQSAMSDLARVEMHRAELEREAARLRDEAANTDRLNDFDVDLADLAALQASCAARLREAAAIDLEAGALAPSLKQHQARVRKALAKKLAVEDLLEKSAAAAQELAARKES